MDMYSAPLKASLTGLQLSGMIVEKQLRLMQAVGRAAYQSQLQFMGVAFGLPGLTPADAKPVTEAKPAAKAKVKPAARKTASKPGSGSAPKAEAKPAVKTGVKLTAKAPAKSPAKSAAKRASKSAASTSVAKPTRKTAPAKSRPSASEPAPAVASQSADKTNSEPKASNVTTFPNPEAAAKNDGGAKRPRQPSAPPAMPERSAEKSVDT